MIGAASIGVVRDARPAPLRVDARQFARWPRAPHHAAAPAASAPSVILLPIRAEIAAALVEAQRLGKRFYLVTRD
jgi:hypothetical protein